MVYFLNEQNQYKPIHIPIEIDSLPSNQMKIIFRPENPGKYRIYLAYRNLPIFGESKIKFVFSFRMFFLLAVEISFV